MLKLSYILFIAAAALPKIAIAQTASAGASTDWPEYGGSAASTRYSPLTQISRQNVTQLKVAWTFDTGDAFEGSEMQCQPIIVHGTLYATTPKLRLIALDASSGKLKWAFDPNTAEQTIGKSRNRGVTFWEPATKEPAAGARIFVVARHYLYAVDASTGQLITSFGQAGRVDLREGLGRSLEGMSISATSPGVIYKDMLILGSIVNETLPAAPGDIRAFDVRSGKVRWTFHTLPRPGEFGYQTWPKDAWTYIGGVNNWAGMALDRERGLLFAPTGSAAFDFYGSNRIGDNLFANTILALDANTGERVWHFQAVHHDLWDRDFPAPPSLVTIKRDGQLIDAVSQTTKSGFVMLFERTTGRPLFPLEEHPFQKSDVDGEVTSATQPLPVKPPPFARQRLDESDLTDRTPTAHETVLARFRSLRSDGQFVPPSLQGTIILPGFDGGAEWGGTAFDAESGLLYVNANEMAWIMKLVEREKSTRVQTGKTMYAQNCAGCHGSDRKGSPPQFPALVGIGSRHSDAEILSIVKNGNGRMPAFAHLGMDENAAIVAYIARAEEKEVVLASTGTPSPIDQKYRFDGYTKFLDPDGYPAMKPPWGTLNAIDLSKGEIRWRIPFGEHPELVAAMGITGSENYGGPVVTAGGVLFIGATTRDSKFRAFDKATGKLLWETVLPAGGNATPSTYAVNGRQYVVIASGGGKSGAKSGGTYVAFALP